MSASTTGAATVSAPTVSAPAVSAPKSPSAVYSHSGGGRQETGAGGRGAGWSPSVSSHSSSSSLMGEDMAVRPTAAAAAAARFSRRGISRVPSSPYRGPLHF